MKIDFLQIFDSGLINLLIKVWESFKKSLIFSVTSCRIVKSKTQVKWDIVLSVLNKSNKPIKIKSVRLKNLKQDLTLKIDIIPSNQESKIIFDLTIPSEFILENKILDTLIFNTTEKKYKISIVGKICKGINKVNEKIIDKNELKRAE